MMRTQREILEDVAAGRISPEDAARELAGEQDVVGEAEEPSAVGDGPDPPPAGDVTALRIVAAVGSVRVIGDPSVAGAVATGPHRMHRTNGTLVITSEHLGDMGEPDVDEDEAGRVRTGAFAFDRSWGRIRRIPILRVTHGLREVTEVRVNPRLPLSVDVSAGSARVSGIEAPMVCDVSAGSCKVDGLRGSISGDVSAGSLTVRGVITGDGELSCEAGSLSVELEPGSDVTVAVDLNLGSTNHTQLVAGTGAGRLGIRGSLASVKVDVVER